MRGMAYCFFHRPGRRNAEGRRSPRNKPLELPNLVDRAAILASISQVLNALGSQKISRRAAGQLIHALQVAASSLRRPGRTPTT